MKGEDIDQVAENLVRWMADNGIGLIDPVAHNLPFDLRFFGMKFPELANIFSGRGRDSMQLAIIINDVALSQTGKKLFPSVGLQNLKAHFGMAAPVQHRAAADALNAAVLYQRLLQKLIINN